jgi:hypothetical protein
MEKEISEYKWLKEEIEKEYEEKELHKKQLMCLDTKQLVELVIQLEGYNKEWIERCEEITGKWRKTINDFKI